MAIKAQYTTSSGIELEEAYVNIATIYINKQINGGSSIFSANLVSHIYVNEEAYRHQKKSVETFNLMFNVDNTLDIFSQAYSILKDNGIFAWKGDC